jgi:Cu+-exporting ATPase
VAILEGRFLYFCHADCKRAHFDALGRPQEDNVPTASPPEVAYRNAEGGPATSHVRPKFPSNDDVRAMPSEDAFAERTIVTRPWFEEEDASDASFRATLPSPGVVLQRQPDAPRVALARGTIDGEPFPVVDTIGIVLGVLVPAIGLLGPAADVVRLPFVVASWLALVAGVAVTTRDPADPHPLVVVVPAGGAVAAACWAAAIHDAHMVALAVFAGLSCAVAIAVETLLRRARRRVNAARAHIERALDLTVRALHGGREVVLSASDVRPGEQFVVEAGELVGVDATVLAGEARVTPWLDARVELLRREGDPVLAGARVLSNGLRLTTTRSGRDRAWVKLLSHPATRIDVASPTARAMRLTVERGAPLAAVVAGFGAFVANAAPVEVLAAACAGAIALGAKAACSMGALHFSRAHLKAMASGITYKDARAFERAAAANVAVLSARGTVLMGEPEIVAIESVGPCDIERVLSLAAGAENGSTHPFAAAVLRAAKMRDLRPDDVRNATVHPGLGVMAVASSGERLVVGGRALMLKETIGVAVSDQRVSELESEGRSVLLVALGDRVIGIIALQDGLQAGARAAVQRLLDARIEPVLMSGEARDTCDTIGRALDIENVRPEVLPGERGTAVRALSEGGNVVAVIGHPMGDDGALGAADVAVAMGTAGATPGADGAWAVVLASDDVRDAALALTIPHAARDRARVAIALGLAPGLVSFLAIAFGVASPVLAPIAAMIAAVAVAAHARESAL